MSSHQDVDITCSAMRVFAHCECGHRLYEGPAATLIAITAAHIAHRQAVADALTRERAALYNGPDRRHARPILAAVPADTEPPRHPSMHRHVALTDPTVERTPTRDEGFRRVEALERQETELLVRIERLERIVHRLVEKRPVETRQASMEEVKGLWDDKATMTSGLACRCDGPEHDPDCYKRYS